MAVDKVLLRIEAKLDAILQRAGLDPAEFGGTQEKAQSRPPRELTAAEQEAIDNAPKHIPAVDRNANTPAPAAAASTASVAGSVGPAWAAGESERVAPPAPAVPADVQVNPPVGLVDLGLTADQEAELREAGYGDRAALIAATDDDLLAVPTIGTATVKNLRAKLK